MNWEEQMRRQREAFDEVESPRTEHMWSRIREGLTSNPEPVMDQRLKESNGWQLSVGRYWRWSIAASIVLAIGLFLLWPYSSDKDAPTITLSDYYPEFADEEQRYQQLITQKEAAIGLNQLDKAHYKSLFSELALLDKIHEQYLKDLPRYYNNEQLIRTLIKYYEHKIRILERLSLEIEKKKHHEERHRETSI